jgi:cobalt transporter subunit CbtB
MTTDAYRERVRETAERTQARIAAAVFILIGAALLYLVLFDQTMVIHEFFHDGRHLWNAACH